jgi:hypothetical protein
MPIMQSRRIGMQAIFLACNGVSAYPPKYGKNADIGFPGVPGDQRKPGFSEIYLVELRGFEPLTSAVQASRA